MPGVPVRDVLAGPREHLRPIVILSIHTGMRKGEILSLRWSQVDLLLNIATLLCGFKSPTTINEVKTPPLRCSAP